MAASRESILENADAYTVDELFAFVADGTITLSSLRSSSATAEQISEVTKKVSEAEEAEKLEKQRQKAEAAERKRQQKEMKARESVRMYDNLKFSWGHIIAFLALIFMGYVTFVGLTYMLDDGFTRPLWITLGILAAIIAVFVGAQQFKGISNQHRRLTFARSIWIERALICISPLVLAACLVPLNHALGVNDNASDIRSKFNQAIVSVERLFADYEEYADKRVEAYREQLQNENTLSEMQKKIDVAILEKVLHGNYEQLYNVAKEWITQAKESYGSTWNVFLVGNTREIEQAFDSWSKELVSFSGKHLTTEKNNTGDYKVDTVWINGVKTGLKELREKCQKDNSFNWPILLWGLLLYAMLILPYLIQERNGRNLNRLFGEKNEAYEGGNSLNGENALEELEKTADETITAPELEATNDDDESEAALAERSRLRRAKRNGVAKEEQPQRKRRNDDDDDEMIAISDSY